MVRNMRKRFDFLRLILKIADQESDSQEQKRQHVFLIYMGLLMSLGGVVWGSLCLFYELYLAAIIPFIYISVTFINVLWSVLAVFGSFTLSNKSSSIVWLGLFILLMILSGIIDPYAKEFDTGLVQEYIVLFFVINFIFVIAIIFSLYYYFVSSEEKAKRELQKSLEELKQAQQMLIDTEKMASLGSLVSGVAHEINTPLGVGLTGVSQIDHEIKKIESNYHAETLTEEALLDSVGTIKQLTQTIKDRLNNAVTLVRSFKNISVDQHFEDKREFVLYDYIQDLIVSLQNPLKSKNVSIVNNTDKSIILESYSGIFSQIISNLILNSITHGFGESLNNTIEIDIIANNGLKIEYRDNGVGISEEVQKKIFDPFFTTKRGQGGSGLGMNIIYNLVTQKLGGTIDIVKVSPHGLGFNITLESSHIKA